MKASFQLIEYKLICIHKQRLIFTPSGRFPRAWLQSPRHYVPAGLSAQAYPAGVATLRKINCSSLKDESAS